MSRMRTAGAAMAVAIAIGATGCASPITSAAPGAPATSAAPATLGALPPPPATAVPRYLACGAPAAKLGELSGPHDRVQLRITTISGTAGSVTAGYKISSPVPGEGIVIPFVPVPPTLVLIHDDAITGVQPTESKPLPPGEASAGDPVLRPLPYSGTLTLARLCPGQAWPQVWRDRAGYTVAVVVTRLTMPQRSINNRLLSEAVATP